MDDRPKRLEEIYDEMYYKDVDSDYIEELKEIIESYVEEAKRSGKQLIKPVYIRVGETDIKIPDFDKADELGIEIARIQVQAKSRKNMYPHIQKGHSSDSIVSGNGIEKEFFEPHKPIERYEETPRHIYREPNELGKELDRIRREKEK